VFFARQVMNASFVGNFHLPRKKDAWKKISERQQLVLKLESEITIVNA
jgi:hypothetical protein